MSYRHQVVILFTFVILYSFIFSSAHAYVFTPENPSPGPDSIYLSYNPIQSMGATLALDIKMNSLSATTPVFGTAFDLDFDPAVLTFAGFVEGDFFQKGDLPGNGTVKYLAVMQSGTLNKLIVGISQNAGDTGASGSGVIITLKFNVAMGSQTLQSNISFSNMNFLSPSWAVINGISWQNGLLTQSPLIIDTSTEVLDTKEKFNIKKDIFLYSKFRNDQLMYLGTEVTEKCDLRTLKNYDVLMLEFKFLLSVISGSKMDGE